MKLQSPDIFADNVITFSSESNDDFSSLNISTDQYFQIQQIFKNDHVFVHTMSQEHGDNIVLVDNDNKSIVYKADAAITQLQNVVLSVRTADCLPVFLFDQENQIIAVVHAGWKSTQKCIVEKTLSLMNETFNSINENIKVYFGPAIQSCCYEVSEEFVKYFPDDILIRENKKYLDLASVNRRQLIKCGILKENIVDCAICTCCNNSYHSYRKDKEKAGRNISLIMLREK